MALCLSQDHTSFTFPPPQQSWPERGAMLNGEFPDVGDEKHANRVREYGIHENTLRTP